MQVLLAVKVVRSAHTALGHAKEVLDIVRGLAVFADIDAAMVPAMAYCFMIGKLFSDFDIEAAFVGM